MDLLLYNQDRHPGNILVTRGPDGSVHLVPIDMDMILPGYFTDPLTRGLHVHKRAKEPLTEKMLSFLKALDPDLIEKIVLEEGLSQEVATQAKILAITLKTFVVEGVSIADVYEFINRRLPLLVTSTKKLEGDFWQTFARGVEQELAIYQAKKTRKITFGTTYVAGNPERDELSSLVSTNQQEYAAIWDLDWSLVTDNLLKGECEGSIDCVPYWNKVAVLREWLKEPKKREEEWFILADDDMLVTDMGVKP